MSSEEVAQLVTEENELSELLDSALNDFNKPKTTDDDLDEFMSSLDRNAAQKAAKNFHEMLEKIAEKTNAENKESNSKFDLLNSKDDETNFLKQINNLLQQTKSFTETTNDKNFLESLENLDENSPIADDLMNTIFNAALSKDVMYSAVKEMNLKYTDYFKNDSNNLDSNLKLQYLKQHKIISELQKEYEKDESLKLQNNEFQEAKSLRISKLWIELQSQGVPPPEIASGIEMLGAEGFGAGTSNPTENCLLM